MQKTVMFASLCLASSLGWAEGELQEQASFPFTVVVAPSYKVTLELDKNNTVIATLPGWKEQKLFELEPLEGEEAERFPVAQVGDFNFDETQDIAIRDGIGYGGVNVFYRVFFGDANGGKLKEFSEPVSNPVLDAEKQTLTSAQRSGPAWYSTVFRSMKGKLYPAMETQMLPVGDSVVEYVIMKDARGKVTGSKVVGEQQGDTATDYASAPAATATIQVEKAYLHDKPNSTSKTKMYVIKGDTVTLLDWKAKQDGGLGDGWFLIRYQGKKVIEKWIDSSSLQ